MADLSVDIQDVVKYHGPTLAVDHMSLSVRRGEFFSILGPSGAGKTSILRLLAGFDQPDGGAIRIEGRPMQGVPPNQRPVNLVFQSYALFPHLSVFDNVAFGLRMRKVTGTEIAVRVPEALAMVRLTGKQYRNPSRLSGGEQQRVALARALVNRPAVVLLDEPLGALDQQLRQEMQVELKTIQEQVGITFLYVTHHQEEALTMSDRVAVMHHGRLLQIGPPREIYESPACTFVAGFIGVSNRLVGHLDPEGDRWGTLRVMGLPPVRAQIPTTVSRGMAVSLVLRPERLFVTRERPSGGYDNVLPVRVVKSFYNGSEFQYRVQVTDAVIWTVTLPNTNRHSKPLVPGEAAFVAWSAHEGTVLLE